MSSRQRAHQRASLLKSAPLATHSSQAHRSLLTQQVELSASTRDTARFQSNKPVSGEKDHRKIYGLFFISKFMQLYFLIYQIGTTCCFFAHIINQIIKFSQFNRLSCSINCGKPKKVAFYGMSGDNILGTLI